jgi:hypothetical protein
MGAPGNEYSTKVPGGIWNPDWALYPISEPEMLANSNLVQNTGY